ncbi:hypothetical protein BT63DRAFT_423139 [Microthyrium microscopicum]|uniref:Uncharacterized protein n=1 Tax=Microthyrium microscopicum TaxID=703497 RepID=A0A6A6UHC5_9PEZI|nr:hypothetical protein BT63DRAFT_423139 [Microthyrium microscopicum]
MATSEQTTSPHLTEIYPKELPTVAEHARLPGLYWDDLPMEIKIQILEESINNEGITATTHLEYWPEWPGRLTIITNKPLSNETILRHTSKEMSAILNRFILRKPLTDPVNGFANLRTVDKTPLHFRATFLTGLQTKTPNQYRFRLTWTQVPRPLDLSNNAVYESLTIDVRLQPAALHILRTEKKSKLFEKYHLDFFGPDDIEVHQNMDQPLSGKRVLIQMLRVCYVEVWYHMKFWNLDFEGHDHDNAPKFKHLILDFQGFQFPDIEGHGIAYENGWYSYQKVLNAPIRYLFEGIGDTMMNRGSPNRIQETLTVKFNTIQFTAKMNSLQNLGFNIWVKHTGKDSVNPMEPVTADSVAS